MANEWIDLKINKINRAMAIRVRLYFNYNSYNRVEDTTPRFFLKPVKLLSIERLGFTHRSNDNGYYKKGNRFYIGKFDTFLDDETVETFYKNLSASYPYGYDENDTSSIKRYNLDVKYNRAFQSFYRRYWEDNQDKVQIRNYNAQDGTYDKPYPCIEFDVLEPIRNKHAVGNVPEKEVSTTLWQTYYGENLYTDVTKYDTPCSKNDMEVYFDSSNDSFYIQGIRKKHVHMLSSGIRTSGEMANQIHSGNGQYFYFDLTPPWVMTTGTGVSEYIQVPFKLAQTYDGKSGINNDISSEISGELHSNITKFITPSSMNYIYIDTSGKDASHPHHGVGHSRGFLVDTGAAPDHTGSGFIFSPTLDLIRGGEYYFFQEATGNANHTIYISTTPHGGGDTGVHYNAVLWANTSGESGNLFAFTSGTNPYLSGMEPLNRDGSGIKFRPPLNAPDTLYYACENHTYMGGTINLTSPTAASGNIPGHTVAIYTDCGMTWDTGKIGAYHTGEYTNTGVFRPHRSIYYYTDYTGHAGGIMSFTDKCIGQGLISPDEF